MISLQSYFQSVFAKETGTCCKCMLKHVILQPNIWSHMSKRESVSLWKYHTMKGGDSDYTHITEELFEVA